MKKMLTNNIGLKLFSLLIAAFLWVIVVNIDDPITAKSFQTEVEILNEDVIFNQGKTYEVKEEAKTVTVHVKAKRSVLKDLSSADFKVTADLKTLTPEYPAINLNVEVLRYANQIEEYSVDPLVMQVAIEDVESKTFPVQINEIGSPVEGYVVGEVSVEPESIKITGPQSVVDTVDKVVVDVDLTNVSEDTTRSLNVKLLDASEAEIPAGNVKINDDQKVNIYISMLQTKSVEVKYDLSGEPAEGYEIKEVSFEPARITIAGKQEELRKVNSITVTGDPVEVGGAAETKEKVVVLTNYLPEGIRLVNEAEQVLIKVVIEEYGTRTFELPVQSVVVNNIPSGFKYQYKSSEELALAVKGSAEVLEELTINDITASIDLSVYTESGSYSVPVTIKLPGGLQLSEEIYVDIELTGEEDTQEE